MWGGGGSNNRSCDTIMNSADATVAQAQQHYITTIGRSRSSNIALVLPTVAQVQQQCIISVIDRLAAGNVTRGTIGCHPFLNGNCLRLSRCTTGLLCADFVCSIAPQQTAQVFWCVFCPSDSNMIDWVSACKDAKSRSPSKLQQANYGGCLFAVRGVVSQGHLCHEIN